MFASMVRVQAIQAFVADGYVVPAGMTGTVTGHAGPPNETPGGPAFLVRWDFPPAKQAGDDTTNAAVVTPRHAVTILCPW